MQIDRFKSEGAVKKALDKVEKYATQVEELNPTRARQTNYILNNKLVGDLGEMASAIEQLKFKRSQMIDEVTENIDQLRAQGIVDETESIEDYVNDLISSHTSYQPIAKGFDMFIAYPLHKVNPSKPANTWSIDFLEAKYKNNPSYSGDGYGSTKVTADRGGGGFQHDHDFIVKSRSLHHRIRDIVEMNGYTKVSEIQGMLDALSNKYTRELQSSRLINARYESMELVTITEQSNGPLIVGSVMYPENSDLFDDFGIPKKHNIVPSGTTTWPNIVDSNGDIVEDKWKEFTPDVRHEIMNLKDTSNNLIRINGDIIEARDHTITFNYLDGSGTSQSATKDVVQIDADIDEWDAIDFSQLDQSKTYIRYDKAAENKQDIDLWSGIATDLMTKKQVSSDKIQFVLEAQTSDGVNEIPLSDIVDDTDDNIVEAMTVAKYRLLNYLSETDYYRKTGYHDIETYNAFLTFKNFPFYRHLGQEIFDLTADTGSSGTVRNTIHVSDQFPFRFKHKLPDTSFAGVRAQNMLIYEDLLQRMRAKQASAPVSEQQMWDDQIARLEAAMPTGDYGTDVLQLHRKRLVAAIDAAEKSLDDLTKENGREVIGNNIKQELSEISPSKLDGLDNRNLVRYQSSNYGFKPSIFIDEDSGEMIIFKNVVRNSNGDITDADIEIRPISIEKAKGKETAVSVNPDILVNENHVNTYIAKLKSSNSQLCTDLAPICKQTWTDFRTFSNEITKKLRDDTTKHAATDFLQGITDDTGLIWRLFRERGTDHVLIDNDITTGLAYVDILQRVKNLNDDLAQMDETQMHDYYMDMGSSDQDKTKMEYLIMSEFTATVDELIAENPALKDLLEETLIDLGKHARLNRNGWEEGVLSSYLLMQMMNEIYNFETFTDAMRRSSWADRKQFRIINEGSFSFRLGEMVYGLPDGYSGPALSADRGAADQIFFTPEQDELLIRPLTTQRSDDSFKGLIDNGFKSGRNSPKFNEMYSSLGKYDPNSSDYPVALRVLDELVPLKENDQKKKIYWQIKIYITQMMSILESSDHLSSVSGSNHIGISGSIGGKSFDLEAFLSKADNSGYDVHELIDTILKDFKQLNVINDIFTDAGKQYDPFQFVITALNRIFAKML